MYNYLSRLEATIKRDWEAPALANYKGESFTYEQLAQHICRFHIFYEKAGIAKGDKIALCARNTARWAVSFCAANTYEAVVVPLLSDFTPESIGNLVAHCNARVLITDSDIWGKLDKTVFPELEAAVCASDFSLLFAKNEEVKAAFEGIDAVYNERYPEGLKKEDVRLPEPPGENIAVINYTSGTTSAPKGVMLRYEGLSAMIKFSIENCQVDDKDKIVSMLPMGHIYGLVIEMLFPLCFGCTVYYLGKTPSPTLLLKAMQEVKPFMVVAVPLVMEKIYKSSIKPVISKWYMKVLLSLPVVKGIIYKKIKNKVMGAFGGKVRRIILGGAALNPEVEKCFRKMKLPYTVGYGMTEASPMLCYEDWKKYAPGSCGKPVDSVTVKIDSEDPEHIAGEILAKGISICSGYYNNPEANAGLFTPDGYLHTGDLGIMDSEGNVFIKGRSKNMILSANGQNIYPEEVEAIINTQDYVAESVVVDRASKLVALVYLDADAIRKAKLDDEAVADIPDRIRVNSNRKLDSYSQLSKVEIVLTPFEKTPKMSIKRFLYK